MGDIYIVGDSHVGLGEGDEAKMVAWLERLAARRPKALYLNGDIFHYYIGDEKFYTSSVRNFCAKLRELRDRGIEVHYVEGNRDFFVKESLAGASVTTVARDAVVTAGPKRFLVTHGDMINDHDWPYRFWRRVSKNPVTQFGVKLIPRATARRFVDGVEKKLAMSNFKHKTRLPVEQMEAYGRRRGEEGFDAVVFGHFHHKMTIPAGRATVAVLPAWFEKGEAMAIDPGTGEWRWEIV